MTIILLALAGVLAIVNGIATASIVTSQAHSPAQKALQALLVWLVPFLGALSVGLFYRSERHDPAADGSSSDSSITNSDAVDFGLASHHDGHDS